MSLFTLIAKLGLDSSMFDAGLRKAEGQAGVYGSRIGNELKSKFAAAFGAAAIAKIAHDAMVFSTVLKGKPPNWIARRRNTCTAASRRCFLPNPPICF